MTTFTGLTLHALCIKNQLNDKLSVKLKKDAPKSEKQPAGACKITGRWGLSKQRSCSSQQKQKEPSKKIVVYSESAQAAVSVGS